MEQYSVYIHTNKANGKKYIGITKQKPENRWGKDGVNYKNKCPHFWNAILKYGWDSFAHDIIATELNQEDACRMEIEMIAQFKTQDRRYGYNTMEGGTAPSIPDEVRAKMSASMQGNRNGLGHPCSDEKKNKISRAQKGKTLTEEHKKHISEAKKGKTHKSLSDESRKKIADKHDKRQVFCYETGVVYESIQECARQLDIDATAICSVCKGKHKTVKGYHFKYN